MWTKETNVVWKKKSSANDVKQLNIGMKNKNNVHYMWKLIWDGLYASHKDCVEILLEENIIILTREKIRSIYDFRISTDFLEDINSSLKSLQT